MFDFIAPSFQVQVKGRLGVMATSQTCDDVQDVTEGGEEFLLLLVHH